MPARVESSLLVVEAFTDATGTEWQPGDRVPLARRAVREAALNNPARFVVEFGTESFDPSADWFQEIDARYEERYAELKQHRDGAEERRQQALRDELKTQDQGTARARTPLQATAERTSRT